MLVVRDSTGGVFGAYVSDAPRPQPHYYGTGECFLWRAQILKGTDGMMGHLPPPPSADTTNLGRASTLLSSMSSREESGGSGASTPERMRFKAFPYSGMNDYMEFCQTEFLSVGGG